MLRELRHGRDRLIHVKLPAVRITPADSQGRTTVPIERAHAMSIMLAAITDKLELVTRAAASVDVNVTYVDISNAAGSTSDVA